MAKNKTINNQNFNYPEFGAIKGNESETFKNLNASNSMR